MKKSFLLLLLPILSSCLKNSPHLISYELDGTSNSYEISYLDANGDSVHLTTVTNLWREFTTNVDGTAKLRMRNRNNVGTAIGSIYLDGKLNQQKTVTGKDSLLIELKY